MRVLIACEFSGTVRRAFAARGHDAWAAIGEREAAAGAAKAVQAARFLGMFCAANIEGNQS